MSGKGTQIERLISVHATLSRKPGDELLVLLCSAAPTGDNVFLALFSDQVGNYEHINALQSNTCQDNRWPITPSNLDLWSPALSIKHRISPLGKTLSSVQHSMFKYHGRFNKTRSPCSKYGHSTFPCVNWSTACYINSLKSSTASTSTLDRKWNTAEPESTVIFDI